MSMFWASIELLLMELCVLSTGQSFLYLMKVSRSSSFWALRTISTNIYLCIIWMAHWVLEILWKGIISAWIRVKWCPWWKWRRGHLILLIGLWSNLEKKSRFLRPFSSWFKKWWELIISWCGRSFVRYAI